MIDVNRFILLLKQTKIVPAPEINKVKTVLKKLERGQKLNIKQMEIFQDIATKASVDPMTNNIAIFYLTNQVLKRQIK